MYEKHFGFREKPFEMTPDPTFLYLSQHVREIISTLNYGINERRGFILLLGEPGTGKTTLLNTLIDWSDENTRFVYVFNPAFDFNDLLQTILSEFGLVSDDEVVSKRKAIRRLNEYAISQYERGKTTAIIVDEAQYLDIQTLENLRLLSNLETRKHKLIQLIIAGQPGLEILLNHPKLIQLTQRIGLRRKTNRLNEKDSHEYILYRLKKAGYDGPQLFGNRALHMICKYANGIPRTINMICDNALLIGYALEENRINASMVEQTIDDLNTVAINNQKADFDKDEIPSTFEDDDTKKGRKGKIAERWQLEDEKSSFDEIKKNLMNHDISQKASKKVIFNKRQMMKYAMITVLMLSLFIFLFYFQVIKTFKNDIFLRFNNFESSNTNKVKNEKSGTDVHFNRLDKRVEELQSSLNSVLEKNSQEKIFFIQNTTTLGKGNVLHEGKSKIIELSNQNKKMPNYVVVKKGESLHQIIIREYGGVNERIVSAILKSNSEIYDPDKIFENQVINLPERETLNLSIED